MPRRACSRARSSPPSLMPSWRSAPERPARSTCSATRSCGAPSPRPKAGCGLPGRKAPQGSVCPPSFPPSTTRRPSDASGEPFSPCETSRLPGVSRQAPRGVFNAIHKHILFIGRFGWAEAIGDSDARTSVLVAPDHDSLDEKPHEFAALRVSPGAILFDFFDAISERHEPGLGSLCYAGVLALGFEFGAGDIALDLLTHALQVSSGVAE